MMRAGVVGCRDDIRLGVAHIRLVVGTVLMTIGLLSFASDRYCDGTASSHYACTNPSAYYYYPWWAVGLVSVGVLLVVLWWVRRTSEYE